MADNINVTEGAGKSVAADEVAGVLYQRVKSVYGEDGSVTDVSLTNPQPVRLPDSQITTLTPPAAITGFATAANQSAGATLTGAVDETAPATDTASSGLNGRLQRITQRLTSLIALIPAALTGSGNFKVAVQEALPDTRESWRVSTLSFTTNDDSDNTFTVPANTEYQILSVYIALVTTATVGNRQMVVQALDSSDNVIAGFRAGAVQAASLTRVYEFGQVSNDSAFRDTDYLGVTMGLIFLAPGQKLRVYDKAAVAAAADDMTVRVQIASRSVA